MLSVLPLCSLWQATGIVDRNFHLGRQAGIEFGRAVWRYLTWDRILFQSVPWFRALRVATSMRIACSAACANTGCPPLTSTDFTVPSGATSASILTDPFRFMVRAISGYFGTTRFTTWRRALRVVLLGKRRTRSQGDCPEQNHKHS